MHFTGARWKNIRNPPSPFPANPDPDPMHTRIVAGKGDVHNIPWAKCALAELKSTPRRRFRTKTRSGRRSTGKVMWPPKKLSLIRIVEKRLISVSGCLTRHICTTWTKPTPSIIGFPSCSLCLTFFISIHM